MFSTVFTVILGHLSIRSYREIPSPSAMGERIFLRRNRKKDRLNTSHHLHGLGCWVAEIRSPGDKWELCASGRLPNPDHLQGSPVAGGVERGWFFFFKQKLNEFYYISRCPTIITTKLWSSSIRNAQCIPPPPKLSHVETVSFAKSVSQDLFCQEVPSALF